MSTYTDDPRIIEFDVRTDEMLVNMGPQHPSTHGVLRLVLRTDGEVVSEVTPHLGYLHRCAEKIGENVTPIQFIPYTDRMDYLAAMNMNLGYSLAVEKLCGMTAKVPEKASVIRVIIAEMNRIASHLVGMGAYGLDLGTFSPFLYAFREREMILDLFEEVCGARLTYSYITIGGDPEWDLRKLEPYCGYENYQFRAAVPPFDDWDLGSRTWAPPAGAVIGDAWTRFMVRMLEVVESIRIVRQGLDRYAGAKGSHRI